MISRMYHSFLHWKIGKLLFSSHSYLYNQSIPFHTLTYLHTKKMAMSVVSSNYMINPSLPSLLSFSECPTTKTNISLKLKSSYKSYSYTKYETRKRDPDPKKSALLVIDMQNYFSSIAKPILHNTLTTIHLCRRASIPIFFTRHCHKSPSDYGMLAEWWNNDLIFEGSVDAKLMPEIKRLAGVDEVIDKSTYSAFHNTKLQDLLVERGVKEVIVSGVMTNVCCETTAREAFLRGYRVFFLTDATATVDEELHLGTLRNLAFAFAYLVDCKRLQAGLLGIKM